MAQRPQTSFLKPCEMRSVVTVTFVFAAFAICTVNLQGVPESSDPNCKKLEDANYVYSACTFICEGDEIIVLQKGEKCYLQGGKGLQPNKTAMEPQENVWMENALHHNFKV
uniref:Putative mucin n=1 Tax=Rhipicephalus microplus TaxID=6941 RepID=A0A6G5A2W5_RHIMP